MLSKQCGLFFSGSCLNITVLPLWKLQLLNSADMTTILWYLFQFWQILSHVLDVLLAPQNFFEIQFSAKLNWKKVKATFSWQKWCLSKKRNNPFHRPTPDSFFVKPCAQMYFYYQIQEASSSLQDSVLKNLHNLHFPNPFTSHFLSSSKSSEEWKSPAWRIFAGNKKLSTLSSLKWLGNFRCEIKFANRGRSIWWLA